MAKHTQLEYGRLLKEQLEKLGMCVGLLMEADERGWEGSLILARGSVRWDDSVTELQEEAHLYVDDEGAIRIHYSEPIIADPEKKARYDARQEEKRRIEEDMQLHPEKYFVFEDEDSFEDFGEDGDGEVQSAEAEEDLVHISEKQELELLRALSNEYLRIDLYNRDNENRLIYHGRYHMDACSRNSAKKAAVYIRDELFVACESIERLSKQLGFVCVKPQKKWEGWADAHVVGDIIDDFSQIEGYLAAKRKEKEKAELVRKIEEKERLIEWVTEKVNARPREASYDKVEGFIEQYRQQIDSLKAELAALEEGGQ